MPEWLDPNHNQSLAEHVLLVRHLKPYEWALDFCGTQTVLEIGCGAGYGTALLSSVAARTVALDLDFQALSRARDQAANRCTHVAADVTTTLPSTANAFDVVIAFQVIEHIPRAVLPRFFSELCRVVKEGGVILLTTPNRKTRLLPLQRPTNPYHETEYTPRSLRRALAKSPLQNAQLLGLQATPEIQDIELRRVRKNPLQAYFLQPLSLAARATLPPSWRHRAIDLLRQTSLLDSPNLVGFDTASDAGSVTSDHFFFVEDGVDRALDLVVVCRV